MAARRAIATLIFVLLAGIMVPELSSAAGANDDFTLRIMVDGQDISGEKTIVINPEKDLEIDLRIFNGDGVMTFNAFSIAITFADRVIMTLREPLVDFHMAPGEVRIERITIAGQDVLKIGDRPIATGIYHSRFSLEYTIEAREEVWAQEKNIKIPGNPLTTPTGAAGAVVSVGAIAAILALVKSTTAPVLATGSVLPSGVSVEAMPGLHEFIMTRLESMTRGRVVGNIVNAAKKRIIKKNCPICESRIKHGHCYTCRKSAKEVRSEYTNMLKELAIRGGQLITSGQAATMAQFCSQLDTSDRMATDVVATLRHAKLVKVKGMARKVAGKAVTTGICSGLSAIIWITLGGFAVLGTTALVAILIAAVIVPFAVSKSLQMKARHAIMRNTD